MNRTHHFATWLAALAMTALLLLSMTPVSAKQGDDGGNGNPGTIKVHDEADADPDQRNEPHVDCEDFWVEGFNMAADSGDLTFFSWPPTGDKSVVLEAEWTADDGEPEHHFLAGPFTLPAGHYRAEATNAEKGGGGPDDDGDDDGGDEGDDDGSDGTHTKKKMFWVEECDDAEAPAEDIECPSDLAAVANDDGSITLAFTRAEGAEGTNVYRAEGEGEFAYLTTLSANAESYTDTTVSANTGYAYTVTALFGDQESEDCPIVEVTAIPDFPTLLGIGAATGGGLLAMALLGRRRKA